MSSKSLYKTVGILDEMLRNLSFQFSDLNNNFVHFKNILTDLQKEVKSLKEENDNLKGKLEQCTLDKVDEEEPDKDIETVDFIELGEKDEG